jgi:amidophosphoribosyltransferase
MGVPNGANIMHEGACMVFWVDSQIPNGMTRKPYSGRSFMAATQQEREQMVRDKFLIDPSQVWWKRILLVDDSIVRGTTMKIIVDILLEAWALSVSVLSASPIVHYGDKYGIAMSTNELIGINHTDGKRLNCEQIEEKLFYDSRSWCQKARLFYPSVSNFLDVFKKHNMPHVHAGYFTGDFCYDSKNLLKQDH